MAAAEINDVSELMKDLWKNEKCENTYVIWKYSLTGKLEFGAKGSTWDSFVEEMIKVNKTSFGADKENPVQCCCFLYIIRGSDNLGSERRKSIGGHLRPAEGDSAFSMKMRIKFGPNKAHYESLIKEHYVSRTLKFDNMGTFNAETLDRQNIAERLKKMGGSHAPSEYCYDNTEDAQKFNVE